MIDEYDNGPPTLEQIPLGIGAATESPSESGVCEALSCFVCGQSLPMRSERSSFVGERLRPIAAMSQCDVERELHELLDEACFDERRVLLFVARRLVALGQRSYGPLDIATDRRDFERERGEELADAIVYVGVESIRRQLGKG